MGIVKNKLRPVLSCAGRPFFEAIEVEKALFMMKPSKAPGEARAEEREQGDSREGQSWLILGEQLVRKLTRIPLYLFRKGS